MSKGFETVKDLFSHKHALLGGMWCEGVKHKQGAYTGESAKV